MIGCNKIICFRELSNYKGLLNHVVEVNNPQPHMVHKTPIKWLHESIYVYICEFMTRGGALAKNVGITCDKI